MYFFFRDGIICRDLFPGGRESWILLWGSHEDSGSRFTMPLYRTHLQCSFKVLGKEYLALQWYSQALFWLAFLKQEIKGHYLQHNWFMIFYLITGVLSLKRGFNMLIQAWLTCSSCNTKECSGSDLSTMKCFIFLSIDPSTLGYAGWLFTAQADIGTLQWLNLVTTMSAALALSLTAIVYNDKLHACADLNQAK